VNKDVARFLKKVNNDDQRSCWPWKGRKCKDGYGRFGYKSKSFFAHRVAYGLFNDGAQPPVVMHKCDNPACCNPDHLVAGTQQDNMADKVAKGRQAKGSSNGRSKLNEEQVRSIRVHCMFDLTRPSELGKKYGVTRWVIRDIQNRKTWKHVDMFDFDTLFVDAGHPAP